MRRSGSVAAFSDDDGLGEVVSTDSTRAYFFHCTQIADGSRTIAVGTPVTFEVVAGQRGRWEAANVTAELVSANSFACPVCGGVVDGPPRTYELCPACGWEDDPVQYDDPGYAGGANVASLNDARTAWVTRQRG